MKTNLKHKFITNEKGRKTSIIIDLKDYESLMDYLEDLEDARDLLKAEKEAAGFTPYEIFRKKFLAGGKS